MKKIFLFSLPFLFSIAVFAQNQDYKGFYRARFINFLESVSVIEAEFEIKEDNSVTGTVKLDGKTKTLRGTIEPKGKFEARSETVNNYTIILKGDLSAKNPDQKISLMRKISEKSSGNKRVSENSISGFVSKISAPNVVQEPESTGVKISDNGKTQLLIEHTNPLFGKEWNDFPAKLTISNVAGQTAIEAEMKSKTDNEERRFRFRLVIQNEGQKIWLGKDVAITSYAEVKKSTDGTEARNFFLGTNGSILGGQIEIVSENEKEMIFKITNLQIKRYIENNSVTIEGYVHAPKSM